MMTWWIGNKQVDYLMSLYKAGKSQAYVNMKYTQRYGKIYYPYTLLKVSKHGKFYIWKVSKNGKRYKRYI